MKKSELKAKIAELEDVIVWDCVNQQPMVDTMREEINDLIAENEKLRESEKRWLNRERDMAEMIRTLRADVAMLVIKNETVKIQKLKETVKEKSETIRKLTDERDLRNLREKLIVGGNEQEIQKLNETVKELKHDLNSLGWVLKEKSETIEKLKSHNDQLIAIKEDQTKEIRNLREMLSERDRFFTVVAKQVDHVRGTGNV